MVGTLAIIGMPISQYPDITPPTVQITSNFTGADAQTVEQTTTTAIETQVNGVPGMTYLQSNSANNGVSTITATLNVDARPECCCAGYSKSCWHCNAYFTIPGTTIRHNNIKT